MLNFFDLLWSNKARLCYHIENNLEQNMLIAEVVQDSETRTDL